MTDANQLRIWTIQIARLGHAWLPEAEKCSIRARLIHEMTVRADAEEVRATCAEPAASANVALLANRRRATMGDVLRAVTGRGPGGAA